MNLDHLLDPCLTRRDFLRRSGMGMGAVALAGVLADAGLSTAATSSGSLNPLTPRGPHFPAKAKRVIHLFMNGGPSHVDTFDPKPALAKYAGKPLSTANLRTERKTGAAFPSPFKFQKYGQSGIEVSELFRHDRRVHVDDMAVIRSMHADVPNHEPSLMLMNCGEARLIRPSMGSWVTYGLGTENQNLPGFIAMCPGGYPIQETQNWQSAFLPGVYQGTYHRHAQYRTRQADREHPQSKPSPARSSERQLDLAPAAQPAAPGAAASKTRNWKRASNRSSWPIACSTRPREAFDVEREPRAIRDLYGPGVQARQLLIARRLLETGVRFVQVWHGQGQPWDSHDDLEINHRRLAEQCDQAIGALLTDLKQRGMLEDTLVIWGGEFGRTPTVELPTPGSNAGKINGRDHNHYGFSMWLAGGGVKGGQVYGATDEFGFQAAEKRVHVHDLHATILHLLGFDHEKLTYRYAGRDFRLTDVHGHVVHDLIA